MTSLGTLEGFAADLGGTKIAAARFTAGRIVERRRAETDGGAAPEELIATMATLLVEMGYARGAPLGIAATGLVDARGGWRAVNQDTLRQVRDVSLTALIDAQLGPAAILNDAAAATLAEARHGAGRGLDNFAFLTVSTGVGGGLVLNGRLHRTPDGVAGNLGFLSSPNGSALCGSGRYGTVESVASGRAIERAARAAGHPGLDAKAVFEHAAKGVAWANEIAETSAGAIADLCADLRAALGLEAILLGGSVGFSDGYLARVERHLARLPVLFRCPLRLAETGPDGPLIGALSASMEVTNA